MPEDIRTLIIRPVGHDDLEAIGAFYASLSRRTLRDRYFEAASPLAAGPIDHLVDADGLDRITLIAEERSRSTIVAEAMTIRADHDPELADAAIVIADGWQGRGVGRELIRRLADSAWEAGIRRWRVQRLVSNARVAALFDTVGAPAAVIEEAGIADAVYRLFTPHQPQQGALAQSVTAG
jgi:GNAT superfamily N-acetyltransferase